MPRKQKEVHLFWPLGDDEIQVESDDKKLNQKILELREAKPEAAVIIDGDYAPAFLRAAVKTEYITVSVRKTAGKITDAQKKARSEIGRKTTNLIYKGENPK